MEHIRLSYRLAHTPSPTGQGSSANQVRIARRHTLELTNKLPDKADKACYPYSGADNCDAKCCGALLAIKGTSLLPVTSGIGLWWLVVG